MDVPTGTPPTYRTVRYWVEHYGVPGVDDARAVQDFKTVETNEMLATLKAELISMGKGNYDEQILDHLVGPRRKVRHTSYAEWAKQMMLWLARSSN